MRETKILNFWCLHCNIDWKLNATRIYKNIFTGECYVADCPSCLNQMVRLIGRSYEDPYFRFSKKTHIDAKKYAIDTMQMNNPLFNVFYPKHKEEREIKAEESLKMEFKK